MAYSRAANSPIQGARLQYARFSPWQHGLNLKTSHIYNTKADDIGAHNQSVIWLSFTPIKSDHY